MKDEKGGGGHSCQREQSVQSSKVGRKLESTEGAKGEGGTH